MPLNYTDPLTGQTKLIKQGTDDGTGLLVGLNNGTINTTTGVVSLTPKDSVQAQLWTGTAWETTQVRDVWADGTLVRVWYTPDSVAPSTVTASLPAIDAVFIDFTRYTSDPIVPNSLAFQFAGRTYEDRDGRIVTDIDPVTGAAVDAGEINYATGMTRITRWAAGHAPEVMVTSLLTVRGDWVITQAQFRAAAAPIKPESLQVVAVAEDGENISAMADPHGVISGEWIQGTADYTFGLGQVSFGKRVLDSSLTDTDKSEPWYDPSNIDAQGYIYQPRRVLPSSLRYNAVGYSYLPMDADILGLDPVRLPSDGRVPIFRPGGFAVVGHTGRITASVSNGQTIDCARVRLSRVRVVGHDGAAIHTGYTTDLEAGTVTFTDVSGYSQPVTIEHRVEDMAVVRDVQISGEISFTRPLTHAYPEGSYVSSALVAGDLFARVSLVFDQATWDGSWSDEQIGAPATGTFNHSQYPITVTNRGALTERWAVRFTNTTSFEVIGENVGVIATGHTSADCAPINPAGVPYFHLPALGWGEGWATGNVLRFNTIGSQFPVWVVRTVQQGPESVPDDQFTLLIRGDVDTP